MLRMRKTKPWKPPTNKGLWLRRGLWAFDSVPKQKRVAILDLEISNLLGFRSGLNHLRDRDIDTLASMARKKKKEPWKATAFASQMARAGKDQAASADNVVTYDNALELLVKHRNAIAKKADMKEIDLEELKKRTGQVITYKDPHEN